MNISNLINNEIKEVEKQATKIINANVENIGAELLNFGVGLISNASTNVLFSNISNGGNRPYDVYIGNMKVPITPDKITIKSKNMNKTYNLVNGGEVNIIKSEGLKSISFRIVLPSHNYPYAKSKGINTWLSQLENLKTNKSNFQLIINRTSTNGKLWDTNITVTLENYTLAEEWEEGQDLPIELEFKEYREIETQNIINSVIKETKHSESGIKYIEDHKTEVKNYVVKKRSGKPIIKNSYHAKNSIKASRKAYGKPTYDLLLINKGEYKVIKYPNGTPKIRDKRSAIILD